jgi:hypothetical protein
MPEPKNTRPRRASAPKKPKTKPATKAAPKADVVREVHGGPTTGPNCTIPDWVDFRPLADFRLVAWESDESTVEVLLTSEEYCILKDHLARLRGHLTTEAAHG